MGRGRGRRGGGCKGGVRRWGCERVEGRGDWVEGGEGGGECGAGPLQLALVGVTEWCLARSNCLYCG